MLTSKSYADFVMQKSFKGRSTQPSTNLLNILLWKNDARQNWHKFSMQTGNFPSTRHTELNSLKEPCTFKGKCAVNTENFKCNLLTGPFIKMIFEGRWTVLKANPIEWCIANVLSFREAVILSQKSCDTVSFFHE